MIERRLYTVSFDTAGAYTGGRVDFQCTGAVEACDWALKSVRDYGHIGPVTMRIVDGHPRDLNVTQDVISEKDFLKSTGLRLL